MNQAEKEAVPPRVLDPEERGEAVLPLCGGQGLADGRDRDGGDRLPGRCCSAPSSGPKADPTTTTYVPRPDWYFFFLFEVLRVMKNIPKFTPMATIGVPTICMILLFLLPFYDRSPERRIERRPVALVAGLATILVMAFLTYSGADTGSPNSVDMKPPAKLHRPQKRQFDAGKLVVGQSGCLACHVIGTTATTAPVRRSPTSARSAARRRSPRR